MSSRSTTQALLLAGIDPSGLGEIDFSDLTGGEGGGAGAYPNTQETLNQTFWVDPVTGQKHSELPAGWAYPGAVPVRPGNWDTSAYPGTSAKYKIAAGDTLVGLSTTYLGDPARFREIWAVQSDATRANRSMDQMYAGEWLTMPDEATDRLLAWIDKGSPPNYKPGELPPPTPAGKSSGMSDNVKIAAAVGAGAIALYVLTR